MMYLSDIKQIFQKKHTTVERIIAPDGYYCSKIEKLNTGITCLSRVYFASGILRKMNKDACNCYVVRVVFNESHFAYTL